MNAKSTFVIAILACCNLFMFGQLLNHPEIKTVISQKFDVYAAIPTFYPSGATLELYNTNWMSNGSSISYKYNDQKLVSEEIYRDQLNMNNYHRKITYEYDANNRINVMIEYVVMNNNWIPSVKDEWEYNEQGEEIKYLNSTFAKE